MIQHSEKTMAQIEIGLFSLMVVIIAIIKIQEKYYDLIFIPILFCVLLRIIFLVHNDRLTISADLFKKENIWKGVLGYLGMTLFLLGMLIWQSDPIQFPSWLNDNESVVFLAAHTLAQEIVFRTYLVNRLKKALRSGFVISFFGGAIFAIAHLALPEISAILPYLFIVGCCWTYLYTRYPNILLVWLSHFLGNLGINLVT